MGWQRYNSSGAFDTMPANVAPFISEVPGGNTLPRFGGAHGAQLDKRAGPGGRACNLVVRGGDVGISKPRQRRASQLRAIAR